MYCVVELLNPFFLPVFQGVVPRQEPLPLGEYDDGAEFNECKACNKTFVMRKEWNSKTRHLLCQSFNGPDRGLTCSRFNFSLFFK